MTKTATACLLAALAAAPAPAFADGSWAAAHPRRDQVNDRLQHQDRRIHREVRQGDLSHAQAAQLHSEDRTVRAEERGFAGQDNGHITPLDRRALNQQENGVSRQIGR